MVAGNVTFPIYNSDGTSFNGLKLKKSVYESVVMSLGDKITGDVYYPNNALVVTMKEYITYNGVKYVLVNPPTIVREGMVSDNGELKGMTKYSFTFYHPMYMLGNFPLCDVAVSSDQQRYLSENKTFFWIGNLTDFVAKLNKNLENTEWYCVINDSVSQADRQRLSEVMSFDKNTIADALKTGYETWDVPYIISIIPSTDPLYQQGKRFLIQYGLPSTEILVENAQNELVPFVFHFGQGVGLKNNSRTPRNNKIVTRIAGYGSEDNIQYGYPQIPYEGGDCQYPLYYGIVGGQRVQLIKHPFTRTHLMPSIYRETVNKKVNPMATGYDPTIELKDYYDADNTYENPIKPLEPSYEIHEFEKIKPELGQRSIVGVSAYSDKDLDSISLSSFISLLSEYYTESEYLKEKEELEKIINTIGTMSSNSGSVNTRAYYCDWSFTKDERYAYVKFESSALNFEYTVLMVSPSQDVEWDDTMDDDGNYVQSYFRITIPQLSFDLYASAAITQEMTINMRSGACLGCSFPVMVDWDDYKLNFYDADGNFAPNGSQRNYDKYPDSSQGQITLILQKETSTFGTLMPNTYQKPHVGDEFVILGISLPTTYITEAEARLDAEMKQYMRDNNVYYYDYPLKFDEHFLTTHAGILEQMDNNVIVRFDYAGTEHALYIKQVSVKYENKPLPTYDITLTDNIEVVLNQIGQVVDEVRMLHDNVGGVEVQPSNNYLRKDIDDTAYGMIRLIKGLQVGNRFVTGLLGEGGVFRKEEDGTTYLECDKLYVRMKAYFDTVEVRHYMHSTGNRVASNAGINCSRVEYIDSNGDVTQDVSEATLFRCYFRANDDGREVRNDFIVGDLAFCRETNVNTDSVDQHGYWRAVVGRNANGVLTDDGEGWIDLSVSDCQDGSGIPIAQDDIVQLGNKTDTTRQGAIIEFVSGADAPSYQIYQGVNTYSLNGKNYIGLGYSSQNARAYLNVYGDAYIGDPNESSYIRYNAGTRNLEIKAKISAQSTIDGETFAQFIAENTWTEEQIDALITAETDPLSDAIEDIRRQVDGNIATWFYDGVPTLQNLPASEWTTADDKNEHLGDLYYDNLTGYGYRFKYDDLNRQWSWGRITDVDVVKALADAAKAQDTADHKRRVFVVQPTPPYDAGDLWVNATYPTGNTETNEEQSKYYNDVLRCKTSKASGTTFAIADWSLASKYTDDKALEDFKANQYVQLLTNGTINQNITNAQNAANTAQGTANNAATAAANAQAAAQAAEAHAATLDYVKTALKQDTVIEGGLVLSTLIALRDGSNHIWSGISGTYQSSETGTGYKGHGIAAWYGGAMVDKEVTTTATDYAKSLFRFDGSGYVASGNLSWDKSGNVTIQGYSINATTLQVGGVGVLTTTAAANTYLSKTDAASTYLTKTDASNTYVSIAFFERLFKAYNGSTVVHPNSTSTIDNIKAMFGFWTEQYISALGKGSGGSSGIDMATVWTALGNATTEQINATHLSNALSAYNPTSNFKTINGNSIIGTGNIVIQSSGGTVTAVKVGSTSYSPTDGVVSLPAYPTTLPASDVSAWAKASTKPTYTLDEVSDGSTRKLANYLLKTGGSINGALKVSKDLGGNLSDFVQNQHYGAFEVGRATNTMCVTIGVTDDDIGYIQSKGLGLTSSGTLVLNPNGGNIRIGSKDLPAYKLDVSGDVRATNFRGALIGNASTASSAAKLTTARTIWGQSFDGTGNIDSTLTIKNGNLHLFVYPNGESGIFFREGFVSDEIYNLSILTHNHTGSADSPDGISINGFDGVSFCTGSNTRQERMRINYSGNVGIGTPSPEYLLHINGTFYASGNSSIGGTFGVTGATTLSSTLSVSGLITASGGITIPSGKTLTIGDAVLSWDSTNQGIKISKGLYSQTFISALGQGSSGESGVNMNTVWTALGNNTNEQINASHLSTALNPYATQSWVTQQISGYTPSSSTRKIVAGGSNYDVNSPYNTDINLDNIYLKLSGGTVTGRFIAKKDLGGNLSNWTQIQHTGVFEVGRATNTMCVTIGVTDDDWGYIQSKGLGITSSGKLAINPYGSNGIFILSSGNVGIGTSTPTYYLSIMGQTYATSFIKKDGTSSQFLKADGSVDSNTYATASSLSNYLPLTGGTITGSLNIESGSLMINAFSSNETGISFRKGFVTSDKYNVSILTYDHNGSSGTPDGISINGFDGVSFCTGSNTRQERMRINQSGNVGIGTTSPAYKLDVSGDVQATNFRGALVGNADSATKLQTARTIWGQSFNGTANIDGAFRAKKDLGGNLSDWTQIQHTGVFEVGRVTNAMCVTIGVTDDDWGYIQSKGLGITSSGKLAINPYGSNGIFILSSGNVGIKTSSPSYSLHVNGTFYASGNATLGGNLESNGGNISGITSIELNSKGTSSGNGGFIDFHYNGSSADYTSRIIESASGCIKINEVTIEGNNEINSNYSGGLHLQWSSSKNVTLCYGGGNVGIGRSDASYKLDVNGTMRASEIRFTNNGYFYIDGYGNFHATTNTDQNNWNVYKYDGNTAFVVMAQSGNVGIGVVPPSYKLHVNGVIYSSTGVYSAGYVTALSDIRHKDVVSYDTGLSVSDVANAPMIRFLWKDKRQDGLQVGSIAQYWQRVLPEAVIEGKNGELTMSYGVIALLASIATARKVEDLERRVVNLEKENKLLKEQLNVA